MELAELAARVNWVDLLILVLLIRISYQGFKYGFSFEIMPLLAVASVLIYALHNFIFVGQFITSFTPLPRHISDLLSFILLTVIILLIFRVIEHFVAKMVRVEVLSMLNRIGGLCLGILKAVLSTSLILIILVLVPINYFESSIKERSLLGPSLLKAGPLFYDKLMSVVPGAGSKDSAIEAVMSDRW